MAYKRMSEEDRKNEILAAAARVFIKKGFHNTVMEDIISEVSLSRGGVYRYYSSKIDILYDLMLAGNTYRFNLVSREVESRGSEKNIDLLADMIVEKMLDYNEYTPLYIMMLEEMKREPKLNELFEKLKKDAVVKMLQSMDFLEYSEDVRKAVDFITYFTNAIILGGETLNAREVFISEREIFKAVIKLFLSSHIGLKGGDNELNEGIYSKG